MASSPAATTLGAAAEAPQAGAREEERLPEDGAPEGPAPAAREGPGRGGEASAELSPIVEIPETPRSVQEVVKTPRSTQEAREASPRQEVDSSTPTTIPDGVCKVCAGAKVLRTELTHNCTNCSGKGYCAASSGGNRFVCTFCKGTGQVSSTAERSCEACAGTGCSRTLLDSMPQPDPLEKIRPERGDSLDKVKFEDQTLVLENLALSMSCLLNFLGLVLLIVGFALLVGRLWFMAGIVLAAGVVCLAFAVAQRLRRLWMAGKASRGGSSSPSDQPSPLEDQPSLGRPDPEASAPLSFDHLVGMATLAALPNVFVVYFLSDIGIGLKVYSFVAPQHMNLLGDLIVSIASLTIGALAVFDWLNWTTVKRVCSASVPLVLLAIGSLFKGRKYSWAPILMVLFLIPLGLGLLRTYSCRSVRRASFYKAAGVCMMLNAVVLLVVWFVWIALGNNEWNDETKLRLRLGSSIYEYVYSEHPLDYDRHCGPSKNLDALSRDDRREVSAACSTAATVLFLVYSSPFVAFACNGVMASFCFLERVARDSRDLSRLQQALQLFGAALAAGTACFYASVYLSSASFRLGSTLLAFLAAGFVALLVWGFLEIGDRRLMEHLAKSESSRLAMQIWAWDLAKAGVLIGFNVLIPIGFFLSMLNMKVRRWRKRPNSEARFTPTAEWILAELVTWRWASVLCKACLVAEFIFTMQVGVAQWPSQPHGSQAVPEPSLFPLPEKATKPLPPGAARPAAAAPGAAGAFTLPPRAAPART